MNRSWKKNGERKAEYSVLMPLPTTCTWIPLTHSAVHYNAAALPEVPVWSSLLQLCLLVTSIDFWNQFLPASASLYAAFWNQSANLRFQLSLVSAIHSPLLKGAQRKLPCSAAGCLLALFFMGKLAIPSVFPPSASPGPFRQACGLNLSLTCSCPLSTTVSRPCPEFFVLSLHLIWQGKKLPL